MQQLILFYRKKYPTAFSIERLFDQLADVFQHQGADVVKEELPLYNNALQNVWKNLRWARTRVQAKDKKGKVVKHITGDVTSIVFGFSGPTVITIHDCNPLLRYPKTHPRYWFYRFLIYEWPARRADAVTVISEKTRRELLALTNCPADKLHVIPNFVDPAFRFMPKAFNAEYPTVLQVGVTDNKNIARLAQALKGIPCRLEIVGKPSSSDLAALTENDIDFNWETGISDEQLRQRYVDCDLLSFISTYEGFGLPILEAQVTGRPVITSNLSPMHEVAGPEGAILVDPTDVNSIRQGLNTLLKDIDMQQRLVAAGQANAANYDIRQIATQYVKLYNDIS